MGSVLSFQKLAGELSTDGKILLELIKLNNKPNDIELLYAFKQLYPNRIPTLIEKNFNSNSAVFGTWGDTDPFFNFGGSYFGRWTITAFDGGADDQPGHSKLHFTNSEGVNCIYMRGEQFSPVNFLGELNGAFRDWGFIHFQAHFIGYLVKDVFSYNTDGFVNPIEMSYGGSNYPLFPIENGFSEVNTLNGGTSKFFVSSIDPFLIKLNGVITAYGSLREGNNHYEQSIFTTSGNLYTIEKIPPPVFYFKKESGIVTPVEYTTDNGLTWTVLPDGNTPFTITHFTLITVRSTEIFGLWHPNGNRYYLADNGDGYLSRDIYVDLDLNPPYVTFKPNS